VEQPCVEDIFEGFTFYLKHLAKEKPTHEDMADIFFNFRHNFHVPASRLEDIEILATTTCIPELRGCQPGLNPMNNTLDCGEPTVRTLPILPRGKILLPPMKLGGRKLMKPSRTFTKEILLKKEKTLALKSVKKQVVPKREYVQEEIFSDWLQNLEVPEQKYKALPPSVFKHGCVQEQVFQDKLHTLQEEPKAQRALKTRESPPKMQRAKKSVSQPLKLDYTSEQYLADWSTNLMEAEVVIQEVVKKEAVKKEAVKQEAVKKENVTKMVAELPPTPPKTPSPTPKVNRKESKRQQDPSNGTEMSEEMFENYKEDRRQDFSKVNKIKDKKRTHALKNATGKRVK